MRTDPYTLQNLADSTFDLAGMFSDSTELEPAYGVQEAATLYLATGCKIHPGLFCCDVCGAHYRHGSIFTHENGSTFTVGETCAEKINAGMTGAQWREHRKHVRRIGRALLDRIQRRREARAYLAIMDPAVRDALRSARAHYIVRDLRQKFVRYGPLSEKQEALAVKIAEDLAQEAQDRASRPDPVTAPMYADDARATIQGTILAAKFQDSQYGGAYKMLIAIDGPDGRQKLWGTCPQTIFDQAEKAHGSVPDGGLIRLLPGATVTFAAKIHHGTDPDFAFFKRPTKVTLISLVK